jgi:hypothetical protein
MKLTKGKIRKNLLKNNQTRKKINILKIKKNQTNNTYRNKQIFNLKNKTIKQMNYK